MAETSSKLWAWFSRATIEERKRLASVVKSSVASIRFAAKAFRNDGCPNLTAEFAARIEAGITEVNSESTSDLPDVRREDLSETCRKCPYQIQCNAKQEK